MKKKITTGQETLFAQRAKKCGLKITPQRTAIFEVLVGAKDHPTADMMYRKIVEKMPNISFDTVNRTLNTFAKIGVVHVVEGSGQPKRYDPDIEAHHHFRCVRCDRIVDFHHSGIDDITVPEEIEKQFSVMRKRIVLEGLCKKCGKARSFSQNREREK